VPAFAYPAPVPSSSTLAALGRLVRRHDRDRFLTTLFAPGERRQDLLALYAFNYEVARTREIVTEPMLGRIRLQWWRETLEAIYAGKPPRRHEVAEPLAEAIGRRQLSAAHFEHILAARELDLAEEPPATLAALEAYAAESSASLVWLALEALDMRGAPALAAGRSVGIAFALAGLLRAIPFHARAKRLYLPRDLCDAAGVRVENDVFAARSSSALREVVRAVAVAAERHLSEARRERRGVPRRALPALLPAVLAAADLARLRRAGYDPFAQGLAAPDTWRPWRLTLAAAMGIY